MEGCPRTKCNRSLSCCEFKVCIRGAGSESEENSERPEEGEGGERSAYLDYQGPRKAEAARSGIKKVSHKQVTIKRDH
jgi:hypothetical protein